MLRSLLAACLLCGAATALAADDASNPDTEIWRKVRADLFGDRAIEVDEGGQVALQMPPRAADAAVVPLAVRVRPPAGEPQPRRLYLIIDRNPSPIAGIFEFGA